MTASEFKAALAALGLTDAGAAEKLGVGQPHVARMRNGLRKITAGTAGKVRKMIAGLPARASWQVCPRCGGTIILRPSKYSSGVAVIHRCPAVDGVIVKTTIEPMGVTDEQTKAALARRPGKQLSYRDRIHHVGE